MTNNCSLLPRLPDESPLPVKPARSKPLELPFENTRPKLANPPRSRKLGQIPKPTTPKVPVTDSLNAVETRLGRRLQSLQKRLLAAERKLIFQQRCFALLLLLCLGFVAATWARSTEPPEPQIQPSQLNRELDISPLVDANAI